MSQSLEAASPNRPVPIAFTSFRPDEVPGRVNLYMQQARLNISASRAQYKSDEMAVARGADLALSSVAAGVSLWVDLLSK